MSKRKRARRRTALPGPDHLRVGAELEVEIERILPGGMGLAHARGQTLLVALVAPGDRARVRVERVRGATPSVAFASLREILTPSPVRVAPPCQYFGRCGGCDFQQLTYEAQLAAKVEIISDCLRRIARIEPPAEIHITPAPNPWRYRSRAEWQYDLSLNQLGYFERGSHRICDVVECPVLVPQLQDTLASLRRARLRHDPVPETESAGEFQAVAGDEESVAVARTKDPHDQVPEVVRRLGGEHYRFDARCFFQINHDLLEPLIREATGDARGQMALDLYCGVGLFTLPLARRFARVVGVEGNAFACRYARRNLADAGLRNAMIEAAKVGEWLTTNAGGLTPPDFVLLDPPRAGAEPETISGILALLPNRITYVSCDPATLARDLKRLLASGYQLNSVAALDMFPQTHHVETVVHLTG